MSKIFDFNAGAPPAGTIGRTRELAWPCLAFRVTMPKYKEGEYNALESCVLKLLHYGSFDAASLAEEICLPKDLVQAIILRLQDRACIDRRLRLSAYVQRAITARNAHAGSEPTEYATQIIFRECVGGKLLPMLKDAKKLRTEEVTEGEGMKIVKNGKSVSLWQIFTANQPSPPTAKDVLCALNTMTRRGDNEKNSPSLHSAEVIAINNAPEPCYLRCCMVIQASTGEWRILNPFGKGFSPELEHSYGNFSPVNEKEEKALKTWQRMNVEKVSDLALSTEENRRPYDTSENMLHYPELIQSLKRTIHDAASQNRIENPDAYAVIEWALFYALRRSDPQNVKNSCNRLELGTPEENAQIITCAVRQLGMTLENFPLLAHKHGKTRAFENGQAEMLTVLPLAVLTAGEELAHPLRRLAGQQPEFVKKILTMKIKRDSRWHGEEAAYSEEEHAWMKEVVHALLPDISFCTGGKTQYGIAGQAQRVTEQRFAARVGLHDIFGVRFDSFPVTLKNALLSAEMFIQYNVEDISENVEDISEIDALYCINELYVATQITLRNTVQKTRATLSLQEILPLARQCAAAIGMSDLPPALAKVRREMLESALSGKGSSLGAWALIWLAALAAEGGSFLMAKDKNTLLSIDALNTLRGHGNESRMMHPRELREFCARIYQLIQTIMEI